MQKLIHLLPTYKELITKCIESSVTPAQLLVCFDFIELFQLRFKPIIDEDVYLQQVNDLLKSYENKQQSVLIT